jgi:hypothetical protein
MARSSAAKARPVAQPVTQSARSQAPAENGTSKSQNHSASNSPENRQQVQHEQAQHEQAHQQQASVQPSAPPVEPEDAYLTGTSRSLQRRVLGLNVDGHHAQQHPESPAGQHATGSFTDRDGENA